MFVALFGDYAASAVVGGGSWLASLPLTNVQDDDPRKVARSTNALNASTVATADLGAARSVGGVVIGPTNVTPGATYRIRSYSDAAYSVLVSDSGVKTVAGTRIDWSNTGNWLAWENPGFWFGIPNIFEEEAVPIFLVDILAANVSARYWKAEIFDESNGDGYVDIGVLKIARAFRPSKNYAPNSNSFAVEKLADRTESLGGKRTYWNRAKRRVLRVTFPSLAESEMFGDVFSLNMLDEGEQIFVVPNPDDSTNFQKRSFLATLKTPPPIALFNVARGSTALDIEEVV